MSEMLRSRLNRVQHWSLIIGIIGAVLCIVGLLIDHAQFFQSYLFAFIFWVSLSLGSFGTLMIQYIVKNSWSIPIRRALEAGSMWTTALMALLFVPLLFGLGSLYLWAQPETVAGDTVLQHQSGYSNPIFFAVRAGLYFLIWLIMLYALHRTSVQHDQIADAGPWRRLQSISVVGVIIVGFTGSFAMIDWLMTLEPHWFSTVFAAMVGMSALLAAFAGAIMLLPFLAREESVAQWLTPQILDNLGGLLLSALLFWAYLSFSQFIVIYSGNLNDEIPWYLKRLQGGWQVIAVLMVIFYFFIPFCALLSRPLRRELRGLALVAALVFVFHILETFWLVMPAFYPDGVHVSWMDVVPLVAMGGLWISAFVTYFKRRSLIPVHPVVDLTEERLEHGTT